MTKELLSSNRALYKIGLVRKVLMTVISESKMTDHISETHDHRLLKHLSEPEALQLIPEAMARRYTAIPISVHNNTLRVAIANSSDIFAIEALASHSRMRIETESATTEEIVEAIGLPPKKESSYNVSLEG